MRSLLVCITYAVHNKSIVYAKKLKNDDFWWPLKCQVSKFLLLTPSSIRKTSMLFVVDEDISFFWLNSIFVKFSKMMTFIMLFYLFYFGVMLDFGCHLMGVIVIFVKVFSYCNFVVSKTLTLTKVLFN